MNACCPLAYTVTVTAATDPPRAATACSLARRKCEVDLLLGSGVEADQAGRLVSETKARIANRDEIVAGDQATDVVGAIESRCSTQVCADRDLIDTNEHGSDGLSVCVGDLPRQGATAADFCSRPWRLERQLGW